MPLGSFRHICSSSDETFAPQSRASGIPQMLVCSFSMLQHKGDLLLCVITLFHFVHLFLFLSLSFSLFLRGLLFGGAGQKKTNKGAERRWQERTVQLKRSLSSCGRRIH